MSDEPEIPLEQLGSSHEEASTHTSNNQTSFPTQYYSYYPMRYNYMGYVQPSYLYHQTLHNTGYAPLQYFPYYQTMYNQLTYAPSQFPYHQSPNNYPGYVQPQFTSPPVYDSMATEPPAPPLPPAPPSPSPASPPSPPSPPQPQESLPSTTLMPSRALLLGVMPTLVTEATLRHELEAFGDIRAVQMEHIREGFVTVHFYNMRDAEDVLAAICQRNTQQPSTGRGVISEQVTWADFTLPEPSALPDGDNQGTIVVFNLDSRVSSDNLKEIFEEFVRGS
ncbi:hypothetical protein CDL12_00846 [Handroanthus impetiginosus]|uniref:RRM domain-containing protein n=1 Tax=Handroanthus impetiginosus TaxID=429701 RepID=A0A2G9I9G0_9LAMI|nr:hypothetical protein CDL12_00846 [Handroanthus impetiginosus]